MEEIVLGKIVIISGSPGTGKTSISQKMAENPLNELAVHIHTDDFYQYIRKGYIASWENESGNQNETMIEVAAASAEDISQEDTLAYQVKILQSTILTAH